MTARDHDVGAGLGKGAGHRLTEAAAAAGDERDAPGEVEQAAERQGWIRRHEAIIRPAGTHCRTPGTSVGTGSGPAEVVCAGIAPVLEGRRIFPDLTVHESLLMGAYTRDDADGVRIDLERVLTLFPVLGERRREPGGALRAQVSAQRSAGRLPSKAASHIQVLAGQRTEHPPLRRTTSSM